MSAAKHTPGPWAWFGNAKNREVYLATTHSGRHYVMGFERWGMRSAQPMFRSGLRLKPASELLQFEVGNRSVVGVEAAKADESVYRFDIRDIDCPDARLIAAAPDLLSVAKTLRDYVADTVSGALVADCGDARLIGMAEDDLARIDAAIAKAEGRA